MAQPYLHFAIGRTSVHTKSRYIMAHCSKGTLNLNCGINNNCGNNTKNTNTNNATQTQKGLEGQ